MQQENPELFANMGGMRGMMGGMAGMMGGPGGPGGMPGGGRGKKPKKEKPPSFHSEKGGVVENMKTSATRNAETLPALNDLVGLAGFGLITVQWLMDDVLVLRSFGLASCASMIIFNLCRKPPVMLPVYFNVLFIAVNGYFVARIMDERRDVELCGDAAALWNSALSDSGLPRKGVQLLVEAGDLVLLQPGEIRSREGAPLATTGVPSSDAT